MGVNGIYGLSGSGLDIESMVKVGMMSKQNEYDKMAQKYTKNEWTKTALLDINNQITTFNMTSLTDYKLSSKMNARTAESSNESAVKASANATAALMSHKVKVESLSANAYVTSQKDAITNIIQSINGNSSADVSKAYLKDILFSGLTDYTWTDITRSATGTTTTTTTLSNNDSITNSLNGTTETQTTTFNDGRSLTLTTQTDADGNVTKSATYYDGTNTFNTSDISTVDGKTVMNFSTGDDETKATTGYLSINLTTGATGAASIDVITREKGITGKIAGTTTDVSGGFSSGDGNTVELDDVAIAFKVGDGTGETGVISYTYKQLLGDSAGGTKPLSMNDLVSKINSEINSAGLNIKAAYDNNNEVFSFYNSKSGAENQIKVTAVRVDDNDHAGSNTTAGNVAMAFFNNLGLKQSEDGKLTNSFTLSTLDTAASISGTYGKAKIDGVEYDKIADNKITTGGVTYNLLNTTGTNGAATVTVGQDTDAIVDKVKSFVESYNKILSSLYEKYDEKKETGYNPLTQTQKDQMKDEQVEKWEEKAKKGLLYHDQTLGKIITQMRNAISGTIEGVDGKYNSVYSIGISTTGIKGQLTLDEDKLKAALAADGDSVYNVFAKLTTEDANGNKLSDSESYNRSGIAQRLGDIFTNATKLIKSRAGSSADITEDSDLNNLLRELQTKMSNFKKLMTAFEDRLFKKYDAMEVALSKLGTQLNFITGGQ